MIIDVITTTTLLVIEHLLYIRRYAKFYTCIILFNVTTVLLD